MEITSIPVQPASPTSNSSIGRKPAFCPPSFSDASSNTLCPELASPSKRIPISSFATAVIISAICLLHSRIKTTSFSTIALKPLEKITLLVQNVTFRSQTSTTASSAPARFDRTWLVKPNSIYVGIAHIAFSALQSRVVEGVHRNAALFCQTGREEEACMIDHCRSEKCTHMVSSPGLSDPLCSNQHETCGFVWNL